MGLPCSRLTITRSFRTGEGTGFVKPTDRRIAEELKQRLSAVVRLIDFRIFGSRARGDASPDSDMDVFIELEAAEQDTGEKIMDVVWEVGFDNGVLISPLVMTREEIERSPLRSAPIVRSVLEEGVTV